MENPRQQLLEQIQKANNVLITVSRNPSLDQLAAAIGLTLLLNKLEKHATAVFSGEVPSILEYLKPEQTIEKNTDSLRDFIISLDKAKADKLRYKVEEQVVKIFITPYRTSLSQDDLVFSQGDFNVDLVIGLGVHEQKDLDQAIVSHGRILHDATVSSINTSNTAHLGTIGWTDTHVSSLCEMVYNLAADLNHEAIDSQMATAFLTGIVAETKRFSNEKTSAQTMEVSSQLLSAGANQQLVAAKLEVLPIKELPDVKPQQPAKLQQLAKPKKDPSTLEVKHQALQAELPESKKSQPAKDKGDADSDQSPVEINIDENGYIRTNSPANRQTIFNSAAAPEPEHAYDPALEDAVRSIEADQAKNDRRLPAKAPTVLPAPTETEATSTSTEPAAKTDPAAEATDQTLTQIEKSVGSPHLGSQPVRSDGALSAESDTLPSADQSPQEDQTLTMPPDLEEARNAVEEAVASSDAGPLPPRDDLNASPGLQIPHSDPAQLIDPTPPAPAEPTFPQAAPDLSFPQPTYSEPPAPPSDSPSQPQPPASFDNSDQNQVPPLPPPIMPSQFSGNQDNQQ